VMMRLKLCKTAEAEKAFNAEERAKAADADAT
jgi:hypothetical protein